MDWRCVKLEMKFKKYEVELVKNTTEFEIFEDWKGDDVMKLLLQKKKIKIMIVEFISVYITYSKA